jgi:hypothetical protein
MCENIQDLSSHQGETAMSNVEMTAIASGMREVTDIELAMVTGAGFWGDLAKLAGGVIGKAVIGGATGATVGAFVVIVGQAVYGSYDSSQLNNLSSTSIGDAAL